MEIIHDKVNKEFVLPLVKGQKAKIRYTSDDASKMIRLVYSEVPEALRGQSIGKELVLKTFEKLTEEGYKATAVCPYIKHVVKKDPKWSTIINH